MMATQNYIKSHTPFTKKSKSPEDLKYSSQMEASCRRPMGRTQNSASY